MNQARPSRAKDFFEQIKTGGVAFLKSLVNSDPPTVETDWLDFKGAERLNETDMKVTWSKALSGFANTEGGVLVWGIDARKDKETGIDCAVGFSLVQNPDRFLARLKTLQPRFTDPPLSGVDYWSGIDDPTADTGFVACCVSGSDFKPVRAEAADRNYYIRAGDSFHVPSVSLLKTLFYPQRQSRLVSEMRSETDVDGKTFRLTASIRNTGVVTAKNVAVVTLESSTAQSLSRTTMPLWIDARTEHPDHSGELQYELKTSGIHPGGAVNLYVQHGRVTRAIQPMVFRFRIFCEDSLPVYETVSFDLPDFWVPTVVKRGTRSE